MNSSVAQNGPGTAHPSAHGGIWVSIVVLNYNAASWMQRCLESIQAQTIFDRVQLIVADNLSTDGSAQMAQDLTRGWTNAIHLQNGFNAGFGGGINLAVPQAAGRYILVLNPDVWLEPRCLEELYLAAEAARAGGAVALILDYENDAVQSRGGMGFDFTGQGVEPPPGVVPERLLMGNGFAFIRRDLFTRLGGYDDCFFLYGEELDIGWRIWLAGEQIVFAPKARIHHRGAVSVNPKGGTKMVEIRTSDSKRFYANRNHLLCYLKNARHVLLLLLVPCLMLFLLESALGAVLTGRWSFFQRSFWDPIRDCWRLRGHIRAKRQQVAGFRQRGDFWMLRFLTWRFSRWDNYKTFFRLGLPKINAS